MELTERQQRAKKTAEMLGLHVDVHQTGDSLFLAIMRDEYAYAEDRLFLASRVSPYSGRVQHFAGKGLKKIPLNRVGIWIQVLGGGR